MSDEKNIIEYILWIEDEPQFEEGRIRKLKKELKKIKNIIYEIKFFKRPKELHDFLEGNRNRVVGIIIDLMLPASEEDFKILGGKFEGFEVGIRLAEVICKNFGESIPIVVLTNLSKRTKTGRKIWSKLDNRNELYCVKEKLEKSTTPLSEFIKTIKNIFNIQ